VVMREDHATRVVKQRALDHLARIDAGLRQRAAKQFLDPKHAPRLPALALLG